MDDHLIALVVDSDDENDWEEVEFPELQEKTFEITLNAQPKASEEKRKRGLSHAERLLRIDCHKIHTVCLLTNARVRNKYLNDELLHARLLSICPLKYQDAFATVHKSRIPDQNQRGRMFENAVRDLANWWSSAFEIIPEGHLRNRTFLDVEKVLERYHLLSNNNDSINDEMDVEVLQDVLDEDGEFIRSPKSLMKHALMAKGSRDTSAQLFTALCRALGIPARLVASLQSVPWQASVGKPKPKYEGKTKGKGKGKGKVSTSENTSVTSEGENEGDINEIEASTPTWDLKGKGKATDFPGSGQQLDGGSTPAKTKGKEKAKPVIKLRKAQPKGRTLGSPSPSSDASPLPPDPTTTPPVFWTEVFSKPDGRWLPVDPIRSIVNKRKVFDPTPSSINTPPNAAVAQFSRFNSPVPNKKPFKTQQNAENRLLYVLAFEEDGYARDVTRRYARDYSTKVAKAQGGSGAANMGGRKAWWNYVLSLVHRPFRLHRDDIEDEELDTAQMLEGMPTTMTGFKDHPVYVLTRHLKQNETLHPPPPSTPELGKFRGEPVYPRSAVVSLKTAENWMRNEGRTIKTGEQPLKMVKARAGTVNKLRELEVLKEAGADEAGNSGEVMQGLYARSQTELYVPDPVVDGIIPKNNFGNIDLYTPSMLPRGATHIPYKGVAKIARKLGFDFAEAVTGFEFKKRRAYPVIDGVVIAKENEEVLLEAFWESERIAEARARIKREERAVKHWKRLIQGLRIRQRLQEQYGTKEKEREGGPDRKEHAEVEVSTHHEDTTEARVPSLLLSTPKKEQNKSVPGGGGENEDQAQGSGLSSFHKNIDTNSEEPSQIGIQHGPSIQDDGGGIVEPDDVVQAFHLPKFQHFPDAPVVSFQFNSNSSDGGHNKSSKSELRQENQPDLMTYDLDDDDEVQEDYHHIPLNLRDATNQSSDKASFPILIPKTMAQFAEDVAAAQQQDQEVTQVLPQRQGRSEQQPRDDNRIDKDITATTASNDTNGNSVETLSTSKITKSSRPAATTTTTSRRRSMRGTTGRKRARKDVSEDEEDEEEEEDTGLDDNGGDDEYGTSSSPKKRRAKKKRSAIRTPRSTPITTKSKKKAPSVAVPTRTLRPRASKNVVVRAENDDDQMDSS